MDNTFETLIERACVKFLDRDLLTADQVEVVQRPLYFGKYPFSLGFSLCAENWHEFDHLKSEVIIGLKGIDYILQSNKMTLDFHVFSSDIEVLDWLYINEKKFYINHLRLVDRACWHLKLPKPKPKGKFYGIYGWRVSFKNRKFQDFSDLQRLNGAYKLVFSPRPFVYIERLSDVLMLKLMISEDISDIEDRSNL